MNEKGPTDYKKNQTMVIKVWGRWTFRKQGNEEALVYLKVIQLSSDRKKTEHKRRVTEEL